MARTLAYEAVSLDISLRPFTSCIFFFSTTQLFEIDKLSVITGEAEDEFPPD